MSVLVLEARDRVGGRTLNASIGGGKGVEVGGQWVGPTQDRLFALARELGVKTFPTYNTGSNLYYREGTTKRYEATGPLGPVPPDPDGIPDILAALTKLNGLAATVPTDAPWRAAGAKEWDSQTFETWKLANTSTPGGRFLLDVTTESVWAAEPRDVSLLHVLIYTAAARNARTKPDLNRLALVPGGAQEQRFVGGSQQLSLRMAKRLGDRVLVVQRFPQGSAIKCQAVYDEPFWRRRGLTGQVVSDRGPVKLTFDNSPPQGAPGVLLGFIEGEEARRWTPRFKAKRRAAVLDCFARYFGDRARRPRAYVEQDWATQEWTRGCYVGYTPPGVLLDYGPAIRRPVGAIHWAGAEYATAWNGYMDGAVRSGEATATEVLRAL